MLRASKWWVDDDLVTNYFDKLIQLPIRVPPLGTQEVRAYMMLLFIENSDLSPDMKDTIRSKICEQLGQTWQGKCVDRAFLQTLHQFDSDLIGEFDTADRLAPLMTTASGILGNPRLIKRFMNAVAIRMAIARAHGVGVDEAILAKMLLFERLADPKAYVALTTAVTENDQGKPAFLADWEQKANAGEDLKLELPWTDPFIQEWLTLPPKLAHIDLRGVLYVSREHAPLILPQDRQHPDMAANLKDRLSQVSRADIAVIMDRLLDRARQEQEWGVPPILDACLAAAQADPPQGQRIAAFLKDRPVAQIKPAIIPKIADQPWASVVMDHWAATQGVSNPVKKAIQGQKKDGNIGV